MNNFFMRVEQKTGVDFEEIMALANAISHANFQDERQVRKIVRKVGRLAKRDVTKEMEDRIVASILQNGEQLDMSAIERMMK